MIFMYFVSLPPGQSGLGRWAGGRCVLESVQGQVHWFLAHQLLNSLDDTRCLLPLHLKAGCFSLVFQAVISHDSAEELPVSPGQAHLHKRSRYS